MMRTREDLGLLKRVRESLADYHCLLTAQEHEGHSAIDSCQCREARQYRDLKVLIRSEQHRLLGEAIHNKRVIEGDVPHPPALKQMAKNLGLGF